MHHIIYSCHVLPLASLCVDWVFIEHSSLFSRSSRLNVAVLKLLVLGRASRSSLWGSYGDWAHFLSAPFRNLAELVRKCHPTAHPFSSSSVTPRNKFRIYLQLFSFLSNQSEISISIDIYVNKKKSTFEIHSVSLDVWLHLLDNRESQIIFVEN